MPQSYTMETPEGADTWATWLKSGAGARARGGGMFEGCRRQLYVVMIRY